MGSTLYNKKAEQAKDKVQYDNVTFERFLFCLYLAFKMSGFAESTHLTGELQKPAYSLEPGTTQANRTFPPQELEIYNLLPFPSLNLALHKPNHLD